MGDAPTHFTWSNKSKADFINQLNTVDCQQQIESTLALHIHDPNKMVSGLSEILTKTANKTKVKTIKKKADTTENPPWFDEICENIKKKKSKL